MGREEDEAFERYQEILDLIKMLEGKRKVLFFGLLRDLIGKCVAYVEAVNTMALVMKIDRLRLEPEEFQEKVAALDKRRMIAHNALISQLKIFNRNLLKEEGLEGKIPIGGIYSLPPETIHERVRVANWAGFLVKALKKRSVSG
ncbi:MAG TPA: DUF3232 domain-containing protein [Candidatus Nanoarchaeia archaeon]|nr:DUF3232 domain-containing protein [Candidatus Nanoarchaeia archaeon]